MLTVGNYNTTGRFLTDLGQRKNLLAGVTTSLKRGTIDAWTLAENSAMDNPGNLMHRQAASYCADPRVSFGISTFWKSIGDAIGIKYDDIKAWAFDYEEKYMIPAKSNKQTADELVPLLLFYVPKCLKVAASNLVGVLMGDHLRKAMIFMRVREVSDDPDPKTGRYHSKSCLSHPYYNKPGLLNRWGPEGWFVWALGGDVPGSKGDRYIPQGYLFEEVGPHIMKNKGLGETGAWEEKLRVERPVGCPFACAR
ncbi:hypothetical protein V1522DRAFT_394617 [Lipomyces starkeyi]